MNFSKRRNKVINQSIRFLLLLLISQMKLMSQNDVYLTSTSGIPFQVIYEDSLINKHPETTVLVKNVSGDKIKVDIKTGNRKDTVVLYLLEKGKPVQNKEFMFEIVDENNIVVAKYATVHNRSGRALVIAQPPKKDSSMKTGDDRLSGFAELSKGQLVFFNNIPQTGCSTAMSDQHMGSARFVLGKVKLDDEKLRISENIVQNNCLSIAQLQELVENLPYELDRVKLVKKAAPHVVDKSNYHKLKESFKFESAYKHVEGYFKEGPGSIKDDELCSVAASEKEISGLVEFLKGADNDGERLQPVKVHRKNHCYTVSQVQMILKVFVHDRDRLEAAKLLYNSTIDKNNFEKLTEEFTYLQWQEEFREFIHNSSK